jgi:two-component system, LytTR family, response regulator LytT
MRILIVEDETIAFSLLKKMLLKIDKTIEIVGNTESISQTINWLNNNPSPDLIFMDINLSDGSAFNIFKQQEIDTPIIFTTAYDKYALDAFKVNSIDYLLKPIVQEDLEKAVEKFKRLNKEDIKNYFSNLSQLIPQKQYIQTLIIYRKDKLIPVSLKEVSCFYATNSETSIFLNNDKIYPHNKTLESIMHDLNPNNFFRANKQYILSRQSIKDITVWFDNRLLIKLDIKTPEHIYISKNKASDFKQWIISGQ